MSEEQKLQKMTGWASLFLEPGETFLRILAVVSDHEDERGGHGHSASRGAK